MTAQPYPGRHRVGGAALEPRDALTDAVRRRTQCARRLPTLRTTDALFAALALQANQMITRYVEAAYAWAGLARAHADAVARSAESGLPPGPLRDVVAASAGATIDYADGVARAATRFGRRFGHLAFAFPRPRWGAPPCATP